MSTEHHAETFELLAQAARSDRLLLFVGSGVAAEYGLPTWRELAEALGNEEPNYTDLPAEFSKFARQHGGLALTELLERKLGKRPTEIKASTKLLLELRTAATVSTNCDRIIETAAQRLGCPLRVFVDDGDLIDFHSTPAFRLVCLHGSLDRKDSLTFTREQYDDLPRRTPALHRTVAELINSCRVLFLGFSMADPDFHRLMALTSEGQPDRVSQMVGLFPRSELNGSWRKLVIDEKVRLNAPLLELATEDFGDTPTAGLTAFLGELRALISPTDLPRLSQQCIIFTNGYTATLKTETTSYLANCLGIPLLATHRYGRCTSSGLLDLDLRGQRYEEMLKDTESVVGRGHSVILDGTFADPEWRGRLYALAAEHGARVIALKTCCEDESYIRARLWRRRLDHSRSEHEVTRFENFVMTYREVTENPIEQDSGLAAIDGEVITFDNHGDREVRMSPSSSVDARMIGELVKTSPLMSIEI